MPIGFLLAMQAGGMVFDWIGKQEQIRINKMGAQMEQAGIDYSIAATRLESENASLQEMQDLRKNLGSQAAIMAARGVRAGTSTGALLANESVGNFNADEKMRKLNLMGNEANLRAGKLMSKLHESSYESKVKNEFVTNSINRIPTSESAWKQIGQGFSAKNSYGFGMTKV